MARGPSSKSALKSAAWPLRRLLDVRFDDVRQRLTDTRNSVEEEAARTREALFDTLSSIVGRHTASTTETLTDVGTSLGALNDEMTALVERMERVTAKSPGTPEELTDATAALLNFSESHRGFAAQRGLWFNPPVSLRYAKGVVEVGNITERIVENAFAFRSLAGLPHGARVLDFGSSESTIALSLAALGCHVTALDLRPYPFEHPNLTSVATPIEEWDAEPASFDAILCVSTIEHVGLGWYGEEAGAPEADVEAMGLLAGLLAPDGILVLTVPYGRAGVSEVQRTYDRASLDRLLEGWDVRERDIVERSDDHSWTRVEHSVREAVAMVIASPARARSV